MAERVIKPAPSREHVVEIVGQFHAGSVVPYVYASVLDEILSFSDADCRTERGGFLLGGSFDDEGQYVEVHGFLPAQATLGQAAQLRFTHETWARMHRAIEQRGGGSQVVGWHHTHPNLGVFFSEYDRFIHRHFFSAPWQIAMVVDPARGEFAFFQWSGEDIVDCGFVWVRGAPPPAESGPSPVTAR